MDEQNNRPLLRFIGLPAFRFQRPSMDVFVVSAFEPEFFSSIEILPLQIILGQMSDLLYLTFEVYRVVAVRHVSLVALQTADNKDVVG